jgi:formylglycine-generating enzyme required for sulfatase activity
MRIGVLKTHRFAMLLLVLAGWPVVAQQTKPAAVPLREFTNSVGMKFVLIEPGTFLMGAGTPFTWDQPTHKVTLTKGFYMQVTEVTQAQWQAVMGSNPSQFKGPTLPVGQVSWDDAQEFLKKLNAVEKSAKYRLPTEAEWEYAARAGQTGEPPNLDAVAWYGENSDKQTHPVGQKQPNGWGLYDMLGNVAEWCADWYDSKYYTRSPPVDPSGPETGNDRVMRGGSISADSRFWTLFTLTSRGWNGPFRRFPDSGFRCVRELSP